MVRAGLFALLAVTLAVAAAPNAAARADGDELVGTWQGSNGDLKETWTIAREKDTWTITGVFTSKDGGEAGSFKGTKVALDGKVLKFRQEYVRKPQANWSDGNQMTAQADGDKLNVTWKAGKQGGKSTLVRVDPSKKTDDTAKKDAKKDAKADEATQKELAKLDGKWKFDSFVLDGKKIDFGATWQFKGETVAETFGGLPRRAGSVKIDPSKTPKEIDVNFTDGKGGGMVAKYLGVYELDGDKLTVCVGTDGKRATELASKPDTKTMLIVFQRTK